MNGCVLDNEQILCLAEFSRSQDVHDLIATIRDRDKTIAELRERLTKTEDQLGEWVCDHNIVSLQNQTMLSVLEWVFKRHGYARIKNVLDEVKALTVSKQEESAEDGDDN